MTTNENINNELHHRSSNNNSNMSGSSIPANAVDHHHHAASSDPSLSLLLLDTGAAAATTDDDTHLHRHERSKTVTDIAEVYRASLGTSIASEQRNRSSSNSSMIQHQHLSFMDGAEDDDTIVIGSGGRRRTAQQFDANCCNCCSSVTAGAVAKLCSATLGAGTGIIPVRDNDVPHYLVRSFARSLARSFGGTSSSSSSSTWCCCCGVVRLRLHDARSLFFRILVVSVSRITKGIVMSLLVSCSCQRLRSYGEDGFLRLSSWPRSKIVAQQIHTGMYSTEQSVISSLHSNRMNHQKQPALDGGRWNDRDLLSFGCHRGTGTVR